MDYTSMILNNKLYDISTATEVAYASFREFSDENYCIGKAYQSLHKKENGEWFIYGDGHDLFCTFDERYDNVVDEDEDYIILPCSEEEAKEWLLKHNRVDQYIEYFGRPEE